MRSFDVGVAGGGPAGSAAATVLARMGFSVLLADAGHPGPMRVGEGLPPSAQSLLNDLGLLERFRADGHRMSFGNLALWGADEPQATDFIHSLHGHGYQLDRARFDFMLRRAAAEAGAALYGGSRLVLDHGAKLRNGMHELCLTGDGRSEPVSCRWVLDASGRSATLSRRLGANRLRLDRLAAFSMLLGTTESSDLDGRTLVDAGEDGWWYSALLPSGSRTVTYLTDPDLADRHRLLRTSGLYAQLSNTPWLSKICGDHGYTPKSTPQACDASTGSLDRPAGRQWVAVGDAALSFDPLSSQGIANALYTGMQAGHAVAAALAGDDGPVHNYCSHLQAIYLSYLRHRRAFYAMEHRWLHSMFWQRRHEAPSETAALGCTPDFEDFGEESDRDARRLMA